jgi:signal transduction histidine kinase
LVFLVTTAALLVGLAWIGWQWLEVNEDTAQRQITSRIEGATDAITAAIRQNLQSVEADLDRIATLPPPAFDDAIAAIGIRLPADSLLVVFDNRAVRALPSQRLLYYPTLDTVDDLFLPPLVVNRATAQIATDPKGAIELLESLAKAPDERTTASALLGLATAYIKVGQVEAALATYGLISQPSVRVAGRPAELLARIGRVELLNTRGRHEEAAEELRRLDRDLQSGRWHLSRDAYDHYLRTAREQAVVAQNASVVTGPPAALLALAETVEELWGDWRDRRVSPENENGLTTRVVNQQLLLLSWRTTSDRFVALVAGEGFVQEWILGPARTVLERNRAHVVLEGAAGRTVASHNAARDTGRRSAGQSLEVRPARRSMDDAQLPWNLHVESADLDADRAELSRTRQSVVTALALLALVIVVGSYLSVRATTREIEAAQLKSDFVAAVSHEFRTPLTLLRQFSDLLADGRVSSEQERRHYYAALQRGTRRLTRLVEDLLDFGRMEAGSRDFALRPVAARSWFIALTAEFQEEVRNKGYTLVVSWNAPDDAVIQAEESALGRALWNLMDNAVKYSPDFPQIWVSADIEDGRLVVRVRDRGIGVSAANQRAIFRKFVRASSSGVHGTGLGLAIVEQIVLAHGGEIGVDSTLGEGSTFSIHLPVTLKPAQQETLRWRAS